LWEKYVRKTHKVEFLRCVIGEEEIEMSKNKVEAVLSWKTPSSLMEVQSFLGFANFYRCFIRDFFRVVRLLTELTKGEKNDWAWNKEAEKAFEELKHRITTAPILTHFDAHKLVIIETDASDFTMGAILL